MDGGNFLDSDMEVMRQLCRDMRPLAPVMYHCGEPMLRRAEPAGWFCAKCKKLDRDILKMRPRFMPQDEFDLDLSDKRIIAIIVSSAIIGAAAIILWALLSR